MYSKYIKRFLDIVISLLAVIILSPIIIVVAILVRINLGKPIIFKQERVGKDENVFTMYKFRTMKDEYDNRGKLLPDKERQTKFGNKLRSMSIDELPELFNIMKGDLSIVGPRPLLVSYLPYYTEYERQRHSVRGGLTQPEVLYGLVNPTWEEQFKYEVEYANNITFLTDCKIIIATIAILFRRVKTDYGATIRQPLDIERSAISNEGRIKT